MGRKPLNKERLDDPNTKETWVKELTILYLQQGTGTFSMNAIAKKLGISKTTFYKYFASKDEIIAEVVQNKIKEIVVYEQLLEDNQTDFSKRFFNTIKEASILLAEISGKFLQDTKAKHPELFIKMNEFSDHALKAAERFYQQGIDNGILRNINPKVLALTDKMFIQVVSNPKFSQEHDISIQEAFDNYFEMKSKGIFKTTD